MVLKHDSVQMSGQTFILAPEKSTVRRTKAEFEAGAQPVSGDSHRMKKLGFFVTPELEAASKAHARVLGVKFADYMRAVMRQALRSGVDVEKELTTRIELRLPGQND